MGTAIKPSFDYLLTNLPAVLTAVDPTAQVVDGWQLDGSTQNFMVIGRGAPTMEAEAASGTDARVILGSTRVNEVFSIPCYIQTWTGGTDQSLSRNAAFVLWDAFVAWIVQPANATMGGALASGGYAEVTRIRVEATPEENLTSGRFCLISFEIQCKNYYIP